MRQETINVYKFEELSDTAKEKAISHYQDINVNFEWWDSVYSDAKDIGLIITSFDLDRNRHAKGEFSVFPMVCVRRILKEHGEQTPTYKLAKEFVKEYDLIASNKDEKGDYETNNTILELESEFLIHLLGEYSLLLQKEYEYLCSEESIEETIKLNEYEFLEDGKPHYILWNIQKTTMPTI